MAADDPFRRDHHPVPGSPEPLAPGLVVVTAGNAGPMTFTGTRTYLLGDSDLAVIDPGPDDPAHRQALFAAIGGRRVAAVLVTHAHLDHSAGAAALAAAVGAPVLAHGDARAARSPTMARLAAAGGLGGAKASTAVSTRTGACARAMWWPPATGRSPCWRRRGISATISASPGPRGGRSFPAIR